MEFAHPPLEVHVRPDRERVIVVPAGEVDLATVGELQAQLDELRAAGWREVVLDLREISFIDSSGLRLLIKTQQESERDGFEFAIFDGSEPVSRVLEITGVSRRLRRADRHR